jgi:preprotein translocase subunit YajC
VEILILLLPLVLLWFFLIRPQQRRMRERNAMVAQLKVGDEVATVGGILGVITELGPDGDDEVVLIEVAEGVELAILRRGIGEVRYVADSAAEPVVEESVPEELPPAPDDSPVDKPASDD